MIQCVKEYKRNFWSSEEEWAISQMLHFSIHADILRNSFLLD